MLFQVAPRSTTPFPNLRFFRYALIRSFSNGLHYYDYVRESL